MAKCSLCGTKKGKRYCSPLDKVICPICCAKNRQVNISCREDCRYLEGLALQQKRTEDKAFSELMRGVEHGKFDDIFQRPDVAGIAFEIESLVRDIYVSRDVRMTDSVVKDAYQTLYAIHFQGKQVEVDKLNEVTKMLLGQYEEKSSAWKANVEEDMLGEVYLRLMMSVKNMSGGRWGDYGYLNYLKNNLGLGPGEDEFITEDMFGNKMTQRLDQ